ncbi:MAG: MTH1187 family thiamine-binding protein [Candidatus Kariarchaeaceae archaeon]|jgi:uncharacterized protein (TIGR00106 family)
MTIICELICSPVGQGTSVSKYVKAAVQAINSFDISVQTHPMGTVYEVDSLDNAFSVAKAAHSAIINLGCQRVVTQLRIDDRRDVDRVMQDKVTSVQ